MNKDKPAHDFGEIIDSQIKENELRKKAVDYNDLDISEKIALFDTMYKDLTNDTSEDKVVHLMESQCVYQMDKFERMIYNTSFYDEILVDWLDGEIKYVKTNTINWLDMFKIYLRQKLVEYNQENTLSEKIKSNMSTSQRNRMINSEFGKKFFEHYGIRSYQNHNLYQKEYFWWKRKGKCRWE